MKKTQTRNLTPNILIDQLRHEDLRKRLIATSHLHELVTLIGPDRTRASLIPFLNQFQDDEQEILTVLMQKLAQIRKIIGPSNEVQLLQLLEKMCRADGEKVALKATQMIVDICKRHPETIAFLVKTIPELAKRENINARFSALSLIAEFWTQLDKLDLVKILQKMASHSFCKLRKPVACFMDRFLTLAKDSPGLKSIYLRFLEDPDELIRVEVIPMMPLYYNQFPSDSPQEQFKKLANNQSWRIALALFPVGPFLRSRLTQPTFRSFFRQRYQASLSDSDAIIASAAIEQLPHYAQIFVELDIVPNLLTALSKLLQRKEQIVKLALCRSVVGLIQVLPTKAFEEGCIPIATRLFEDKDPLITLEILESVTQTKCHLAGLYPLYFKGFNRIAEDRVWRHRVTALESLLSFYETHREVPLPQDVIVTLENLLFSKIHRVRMAAVAIVSKLALACKEVLNQNFLKIFFNKGESSNYLERQVVVLFLAEIFRLLAGASQKTAKILLQKLSSDPVPNVRLALATKSFLLQQIGLKNLKEKLKSDSDPQVCAMTVKCS